MTRRALAALALFVSTALLAPSAAAAPSGPDKPDRHDKPGRAMGWYLALGDSLAAGYQPGSGDDKTGGYVGRVLADVRAESPKTTLVNLACSGETTVTLLAGGVCAYRHGSQLAQAVDFLEDHARFTRLVTIDIGANDITGCAASGTLEQGCVVATVGRVATNLAAALSAIRAVAPEVPIVVLDYYDPFLAAWLTGPSGQELATASVAAAGAFNGAIAAVAGRARAHVALVSAAFETSTWAPDAATGLPTNVARICAWTWMCSLGDIHANDAGYAVLARTVAGVRRAASAAA